MTVAAYPVAVRDVGDPGWQRHWRLKADWLKGHDLPAGQIYRAEFYGGDSPRVRIFCFALNGDGRKHFDDRHVPGSHDHSACEPAREEPRDVPLGELPPPELR